MEITKERLLEIASLSDGALSDGRIISPDAYESVTSIEIITMARMLLARFKKEYKKQVDSNANIYDILDGWGAWAVAENSSIDWQEI
ncbi:antitermination protein, partial [Escherichia coli]